MSLLDDVSIVVTPNGYKAGELYAVVPVPTEGADVIVDGNFPDGSTAWALNGWTISGNAANGNGLTANLIQSISGSTNKQFLITFTISNYVSGSVIPAFVGNSSDSLVYSSNGTFTEVISSGSDIRFVFYGASFNGSISNVSVKEYTSADMDVTRATAGTRVDEDGLVNYAEVLGSELAICGDFECASPLTGWTVNSDGDISIDSGRLKTLNVTGRCRSFRTYTGLTIGKTYETFVGNTGGATGFCHITSGTTNNNITLNAPFFFVAGTTTADFQCGVNSTVVGSFTYFDNISLKENARDNVPRIDYTGGGCPHILAEPQRTNLLTYSEDFSQTDWQKIKSSVTSGFSSPDGGNNAYRWQEDTNSGVHSLKEPYSFTSVDYSQSIFIKPNGRSNVLLWVDGASKGTRFDLSSGTIYSETSSVGKITAMNDGWFKISTTVLGTSGTAFNLYSLDNSGNISYTGDGTSGFYVYGAQLEEGSYATSYIPTSGSTVTRNQDVFTRDGIGSLINSTEGVLFVELENITGTDATNKIISITDGSLTNRISLFVSSNQISVESAGSGTNLGIYSKALQSGFNKIAVKYKVNDCALWVNGTEYTDTSFAAFTSSTLNALVFDRGDGTQNLFGKVKQLQVYNTALTDEQLTSLTT